MKIMKKKIPNFKNEQEEREFWLTHDSCDFIDCSDAQRVVFPNLKPSSKTISIRLPESMLNEIKVMANKRDVPYQSLIKILLSEKIKEEKREKRKVA
ncbi:MAG: BrnA antitoxin family protein [Candidatus Riflebacteria bacterium]|nr:BrnA antitoxin family protein [Candidatus Riflebacteria bacterium]